MKQGGGGEQSSGTMDYVDPLRALEAMGARDIKVGTGKARPRRRGGEDGIHEREREREHCLALVYYPAVTW